MNRDWEHVKKLTLQLFLIVAITTRTSLASTCVHEEDFDKCGNYKKPYPCKLVIHREGDVPLGIRCDDKICFDLLSSKSLHEETKECFSQIAVANLSYCSQCFAQKKMAPLEPVTMTREEYLDHSILDLSGNGIDDQYVEDYNLLTGPIDNINVLYMSKNKLTKIPIDKISQSVHMREIWLDSNEISDLNFTEDTPIMEECEFINLRNNKYAEENDAWKQLRFWPKVLPNLQILDLGSNDPKTILELVKNFIWDFYPTLSRFSKLERLYVPESQIDCTCPMVAAFARYMKKEFKICSSTLKEYPHMDVLKDHSVNTAEFLDRNRLNRYLSYYQNEEPVRCSEKSEWGLKGAKLENFRSLSTKRCPDVSLELETSAL